MFENYSYLNKTKGLFLSFCTKLFDYVWMFYYIKKLILDYINLAIKTLKLYSIIKLSVKLTMFFLLSHILFTFMYIKDWYWKT